MGVDTCPICDLELASEALFEFYELKECPEGHCSYEHFFGNITHRVGDKNFKYSLGDDDRHQVDILKKVVEVVEQFEGDK